VKRADPVRHLEERGCQLPREGGPHSLFVNRTERKVSTVLRHRELNDDLAAKICKDLGVPKQTT
jgi:predicted RNA binding protein YcfA (HicA-like mRNA interferase family)